MPNRTRSISNARSPGTPPSRPTIRVAADSKTPVAKRLYPAPVRWRKEVEHVLIPELVLKQRVRQLARRFYTDYAKSSLVVVSILNGTAFFLPDLVRQIPLPLKLDFIGVSSYQSGTQSGKLLFTKNLKLDIRGCRVLLIDDILDTGRTLSQVVARLKELGPTEIRTCVLLDKPERRVEPIHADYVGFTIPNHFVVGYGLDYAEKYRNLPFIGVLKPQVYAVTP